MEDINKVTPEQLVQLRDEFFDKVKESNPGMYTKTYHSTL